MTSTDPRAAKPSDLPHKALAKQRAYQRALASTCAEVKDVLAYWQAEGYDLHAAIALTDITLTNIPEDVIP